MKTQEKAKTSKFAYFGKCQPSVIIKQYMLTKIEQLLKLFSLSFPMLLNEYKLQTMALTKAIIELKHGKAPGSIACMEKQQTRFY